MANKTPGSPQTKTLADLRAGGKQARKVAARLRLDGWENAITGLGTANDKTQATRFGPSALLSFVQLSNLFHYDDVCRTICTRKAEHALRQGITFTRKQEDGEDADIVQEQARDLLKRVTRERVLPNVFQAYSFGQAFGGAAILLGLPGAPMSEAPEGAATLYFQTILDASELRPVRWYDDPLGPKFGEAEQYDVVPKSGGGSVKSIPWQKKRIHESRLVLFGGVLTSREEKQRNQGWDHSVLQCVYEHVRDLGTVLRSSAYMISDISIRILKTPELIDSGGEIDPEALSERLRLLEMTASIARTMLLDKEEELSYAERGALTYLADLIDRFFLRLATAIGWPVSILTGQDPAGLNASGDMAVRGWYDQVKACATHQLEPAILQIVQIFSREMFPALDAESWSIVWPPLWQMTAPEEAAWRKTVCDTDVAYVGAGIVLEEEVAQTRWGSGAFNAGDYKIDLEARAEKMKQEQEAAAQMQAQMAGQSDSGDPATGDLPSPASGKTPGPNMPGNPTGATPQEPDQNSDAGD